MIVIITVKHYLIVSECTLPNKPKTGFPQKFQKKHLGKKNKNLGKIYQKFLSKIKEICNISLILF